MRSATWVIALVLLSSAAGCGGKKNEGPPVSADELRQRVTATCIDAGRRMPVIGSGIETPEQLRTYVYKSVPISEEASEAFHEITPPPELADEWERFLDAQAKNVEVSKDLLSALNDQDGPKAVTLLSELRSINAEQVATARALGVEGCVQRA